MLRTCSRGVLLGVLMTAATASGWQARAAPADEPQLPAIVEGAGPPLVLLGGGAGGAASLAPHAAMLAHDHRVVRLQTLNNACADSGRALPRDYAIGTERRAMRRSLDALHLRGPVDIAGHSLGALIALDFAIHEPGRVRSLTLDEPPVFWLVRGRMRDDSSLAAMVALTRELQPDAAISEDQVARFHCLLGACADGRSARDDPHWPEWVRRKDALRGLSAVARYTGDTRQLRGLRCPVLIVTGRNTVSFHRAIDEALARELPNVRRAELPGGHGAPLTSPAVFVTKLEAFLARRP